KGFIDFRRLSVEPRVICVGVVHTVFFTTRDAQFDFKTHLQATIFSKYFFEMVMFSSRGSSLRSSMCEENNGLPFLDLYSLPASIRPSIQGNHFFAAWSVCKTTGTS